MNEIILTSEILKDKFTNYVCEKYDIQNNEITHTIIPSVNIEELDKHKWNITLILGNSGSGKSTILKNIGDIIEPKYDYNKSCISQFPQLTESEICSIFHAVGLSSVPTWLQKPNQLSNGERARLDLVYSIVNTPINEPILYDEFTSVVNRNVALSMSYALQRFIRSTNRKIILCSCHFDIIEALSPDYIINLNSQINNTVEIEHYNYTNSEDYKTFTRINENESLTKEMTI